MVNLRHAPAYLLCFVMVLSLFAMPAMAGATAENPEESVVLYTDGDTEYVWELDDEDLEENDLEVHVEDSDNETLVDEVADVDDEEASVTVDDSDLLDEGVEQGDELTVILHDDTEDEEVDEHDVSVDLVITNVVDDEADIIEGMTVGPFEAVTSTLTMFDEVDAAELEAELDPDHDEYNGTAAYALDGDAADAFEDAAEDAEDGDVIDASATLGDDDERVYLNELPEDVEDDEALVFHEDHDYVVVENIDDAVDVEIVSHDGYNSLGEMLTFDDFGVMDIVGDLNPLN